MSLPERIVTERLRLVLVTPEDAADMRATSADLEVELTRETCDWLTAPIVAWFEQAVQHAVCVEFERYIEAGDLAKTKERIDLLQRELEQTGGHVGMYL